MIALLKRGSARIVRVFTSKRSDESSLETPANWLKDWFGGNPSASGIRVNADNAITSCAVYSAVLLISQSIASLPLILYRRLPNGGKERATKHPLYRLLHDDPHPELTSFEWRETKQGHLCLRGKAYSQIVRDGTGTPTMLVPLHPDRINIKRAPDGKLVYEYSPPDGPVRIFMEDEMFHLRGFGSDGINGISPITLFREGIGLTLAAEEHGARLFGNAAIPGGVLQSPEELSDEAYERMKKSWHEAHGGLSNAHKTAILEKNTTWNKIGLTAEDSQFLQTREFQVTEIARMFRVPPHKIGDLKRATFSNIESQAREFVMDSLLPWLRRWESRLNKSILSEADRASGLFFEFLIEGFLRGNMKERTQAFHTQRNDGIINQNEWREKENMNPVKGGEVYLVNGNMVPIDEAGKPVQREKTGQRQSKLGQKQRAVEIRKERSLEARSRLAVSFRPVFHEATNKVMRKEIKALKNAVQKKPESFSSFIDKFYIDERLYIRDAYSAPIRSIFEAVKGEIKEELQVRYEDDSKTYLENYLKGVADRHIDESLVILREAIDRGDDGNLADRVDIKLNLFADLRAEKISEHESIRAINAFSRAIYSASRVSHLVWIGGALDGKRINIDENFIDEGALVSANGNDKEVRATKKIAHPPLDIGDLLSMITPG